MITTADDELAVRLRTLRQHAMTVSDLARHSSSKLVIEAMMKLDTTTNDRLASCPWTGAIANVSRICLPGDGRWPCAYSSCLSSLSWLVPPDVPAYCRHNFQSYMVRLQSDAPISRDQLMQELLDRGVSSRRGIMANSSRITVPQ